MAKKKNLALPIAIGAGAIIGGYFLYRNYQKKKASAIAPYTPPILPSNVNLPAAPVPAPASALITSAAMAGALSPTKAATKAAIAGISALKGMQSKNTAGTIAPRSILGGFSNFLKS